MSKTINSLITRELAPRAQKLFTQYPILTILGARQTGKSTLAINCFPDKPYVNLEAPDIKLAALQDPRGFLNNYPNGVILDEVQNAPELLSYIQVIVDAKNKNGIYILTGSHQLSLHNAISQSLAGRTAILELMPLSISELTNANINLSVDEYLLQGFYPRIYKEHLNHTQMYRDYVRTYVERDIRTIVHVKDLTQFQTFIKLCASRIGQLLNLNNICNEVGITNNTAKNWLSVLEASFLITILHPYYENFGKRIIKAPKIYFNDTGLAAYILNIHDIAQIQRDPLRGQLVENLIVMELYKTLLNKNKPAEFYFYRDSNMKEVDVIYKSGHELIPIEIKAAATFNTQFLNGLKYFHDTVGARMQKGYIIYTGEHEQQIQNFYLLNYKNVAKIL